MPLPFTTTSICRPFDINFYYKISYTTSSVLWKTSGMGGKPAEKFLGGEVLKGTCYNIEMKHAASVLQLTSLEKCMSIPFTGSIILKHLPMGMYINIYIYFVRGRSS